MITYALEICLCRAGHPDNIKTYVDCFDESDAGLTFTKLVTDLYVNENSGYYVLESETGMAMFNPKDILDITWTRC